MYMCEEHAAYIFISNWQNAVRIGNGDRRYACIRMSKERKGNRKYFKELSAAASDPEVQQLWFNYLIRRDLSEWDRNDIPRTDLRNELKGDKAENRLLEYLVKLMKGEIQSYFY